MGIPEGWNDYDLFLQYFTKATNKGCQVPEEKQLHPKLLVSLIPKLELVIDLTNTHKYYNPNDFLSLGAKYQKIKVEGRVVPKRQYSAIFRDTVNAFLHDDANKEIPDKLIGVHCTHGLNRSGFLVCHYMIEEMGKTPQEAIEALELARRHKMERDEYLNELKKPGGASSRIPKKEKLPSLAVDTETDKGIQTDRGYWIDETSLPPQHRSLSAGSLNPPNRQTNQVSLIACVNIQKRELIPDGKGGYFVHITKSEIKRNPPQRNTPQRNERDYQRFEAQLLHPHQRQPHRPNMNKRQGGRYGPRRFNDSMGGFAPPPPFTNHQLPLGNNNLTEDLLRMHDRNPYD